MLWLSAHGFCKAGALSSLQWPGCSCLLLFWHTNCEFSFLLCFFFFFFLILQFWMSRARGIQDWETHSELKKKERKKNKNKNKNIICYSFPRRAGHIALKKTKRKVFLLVWVWTVFQGEKSEVAQEMLGMGWILFLIEQVWNPWTVEVCCSLVQVLLLSRIKCSPSVCISVYPAKGSPLPAQSLSWPETFHKLRTDCTWKSCWFLSP